MLPESIRGVRRAPASVCGEGIRLAKRVKSQPGQFPAVIPLLAVGVKFVAGASDSAAWAESGPSEVARPRGQHAGQVGVAAVWGGAGSADARDGGVRGEPHAVVFRVLVLFAQDEQDLFARVDAVAPEHRFQQRFQPG